MSYGRRDGRYVHTEAASLASAVRTATGQGSALEVGDFHTVRALLDVTAASGTAPTLDVKLQTSHDGSTGWRDVAAFAQKTAVGTERKAFSGLDKFVRWSWTIGGTGPSFTFSVDGEMVRG